MSDACTLLKDPEVCSSISTDEAIQLCYTFKVNAFFHRQRDFVSGCHLLPFFYTFLQITQARLDELNDDYDRKHGSIVMGSPAPP